MIKDSGTRREFASGAVRDIQEGKGRCDLMPLGVIGVWCNLQEEQIPGSGDVFNHIHRFQTEGGVHNLSYALGSFFHISNWETLADMFIDVSKHFEEGAKKYGEYNWQKGIPTHCYVDSAIRHYLKWLRGDEDEPHDRAFVWNILCCIWTCVKKPELNDYPVGEAKKVKPLEVRRRVVKKGG